MLATLHDENVYGTLHSHAPIRNGKFANVFSLLNNAAPSAQPEIISRSERVSANVRVHQLGTRDQRSIALQGGREASTS